MELDALHRSLAKQREALADQVAILAAQLEEAQRLIESLRTKVATLEEATNE